MVHDVTVQVSKESYELGQGVVKFLAALKQALKDGWQPGADLPVLLNAAILDLVTGFKSKEKLGLEKQENLKAFVTAYSLSGVDAAFLFV